MNLRRGASLNNALNSSLERIRVQQVGANVRFMVFLTTKEIP